MRRLVARLVSLSSVLCSSLVRALLLTQSSSASAGRTFSLTINAFGLEQHSPVKITLRPLLCFGTTMPTECRIIGFVQRTPRFANKTLAETRAKHVTSFLPITLKNLVVAAQFLSKISFRFNSSSYFVLLDIFLVRAFAIKPRQCKLSCIIFNLYFNISEAITTSNHALLH